MLEGNRGRRKKRDRVTTREERKREHAWVEAWVYKTRNGEKDRKKKRAGSNRDDEMSCKNHSISRQFLQYYVNVHCADKL